MYPHICTIPYSHRSYQNPHDGDAYLGIGTYFLGSSSDSVNIGAEYISCNLNSTLKPNTCYYGAFYANLGNISLVTTNQISMLISQISFTTAPYSFTNTIQPQIQWDTTRYFIDTLNWVKISGTFIAQGGEKYLTIGNFKDGAHLKKQSAISSFTPSFGSVTTRFFTYILIDDVALYEIPAPQLQSNTFTICSDSDSLRLGDTARMHTHYQWFANGVAIDTTSFITVKPSQTTTYVLQSTSCATTSQTVVVTYSANCTPPEPVVIVEPIIPNVFTPNNDSINDVWRFHLGKGNVLTELRIFNRWGNDVTPSLYFQSNASLTNVRWDGHTTSGEPVSSGVYFYMLKYTDASHELHQKNGYITLIR